jgi:hypothetical protein
MNLLSFNDVTLRRAKGVMQMSHRITGKETLYTFQTILIRLKFICSGVLASSESFIATSFIV